MKITFEGARAYRLHPWLQLSPAGGALAGLLLAGVGAAAVLTDEFIILFVLIFVVVVGAALADWIEKRNRASSGSLAATREGLFQGEQLLVPRRSVRGALPTQHALMGPVLVVLTSAGPVVVNVDTFETARTLEQALELDAEHHRVEVRYTRPKKGVGAGLVVLLLTFLLLGTTLGDGFLIPALALCPVLVVVFWPSVLAIGDDGVSLRELGRERFIPYSGIENIQVVEPQNLGRLFVPRLALVSGQVMKLQRAPELQTLFGVQMDEPVLERAQAAFEHYSTRVGRGPVLPLPLSEQNTGSPLERVRALLRKEHGGGAYRQNAADDDALRRAVDEPALSPRMRAEAAIMLGAMRDADDLERIRRAAERSACRPLRELFEVVADGADEANLARALGRVP